MKHIWLVPFFLGLFSAALNGQVAINLNGASADSSAGLDVSFSNRGFLPPRVMLMAADTAAPVMNPATGLMVYNTAFSGTAPDEVKPGYYFWNGTRWNPFRGGETDTLFVLRADSAGNAPGNYVTHKALHDSMPDISGLAKKEKRFITLSGQGIKSDASLAHNSSVFGTDQTAAIQAILNRATDSSSLCIIWDTKVSVSGLRIRGNTEIHAIQGCGAILRNSSNKSLFTNYNITFDSAAVSDKNIVIDGGIWNGNSLGNTELANSTNGIHCIFAFYGVANLTIKNVKEYDAPAYFNHIVNANHFTLEDFIISYIGNSSMNNDGVNINHSCNGIVRDGYISTNDDGIAISADDQFCYSLTQTYPYYVNAAGPIKNIIVENIVFADMRFGVRVLSSGSRIDNIVVRNLSGSTKNYAMVIDNFWQEPNRICNHAWGNIGTIHCENINVATLYENINWVRKANVVINCNAEKLIFRDFKRTDFSNTYPSILVSGSNTNINNLIIDGYDAYDSTLVNDNVPHIQIDSATVTALQINRATLNIKHNGDIGSSLVLVKNGGKVTQLSLNGIVADKLYNIVYNPSGIISNITANHIVHTNYAASSFKTTPTIQKITLSNYHGNTILSGSFTEQDGDAFGAISQYGVSNYIPVFYSAKGLYPSGMYTDGMNFGISTNTPDSSLTVAIDTNQATSTGGGHFQGGLQVDKSISTLGCLKIKAPSTISGNYGLLSVDGLNRVTYNVTNSGRTNTIAYDAGGAVACLYNLSTNPVPDQLAGHYAFGSNNSQNESHTVGYLLCALNDPSYSAMNSSLYLAYMDNVNGRPGGAYSYQQPNKGVLINRYGIRLPKIPLYDQSDTITVASNFFVRKNAGIGTRHCQAKLGVNLSSLSAGISGIGAAWDSTYAVFGDASSDHGPGIGIGFDRSTGSGVIACGKPGYTWLNMRWNALSHTLYARTDPMLRVNEHGVVIGSNGLGLVQDSVLTTGSGHFKGGLKADGVISASGGTSADWNAKVSVISAVSPLSSSGGATPAISLDTTKVVLFSDTLPAGVIATRNEVAAKQATANMSATATASAVKYPSWPGMAGYLDSCRSLDVKKADITTLGMGTIDSAQLSMNGYNRIVIGYSSGIVIDTLVFVGVGAASQVTLKVCYGTDISAPGTEVIAAGTAVTSVSAATRACSFDNATVSDGNIIWCAPSSITTVPRRIAVFVKGHRL